MRRMIPLILVVLVVLGSINVINSMVSSQIDSLNYSMNSILGINIRPARRDSALESNIRALNMFIEDIRESNIEVDFSFDDFAIGTDNEKLYPQGEERKELSKRFDKLFKLLKQPDIFKNISKKEKEFETDIDELKKYFKDFI